MPAGGQKKFKMKKDIDGSIVPKKLLIWGLF